MALPCGVRSSQRSDSGTHLLGEGARRRRLGFGGEDKDRVEEGRLGEAEGGEARRFRGLEVEVEGVGVGVGDMDVVDVAVVPAVEVEAGMEEEDAVGWDEEGWSGDAGSGASVSEMLGRWGHLRSCRFLFEDTPKRREQNWHSNSRSPV